MRHPLFKLWSVRSGAIALAISFFSLSPASQAFAASNTTWRQATRLPRPVLGQVLYGELGSAGSGAFFRFTIAQPGTLPIVVGVPTWANKDFQPNVVVYQPESMTVGPVLPMEQPPETSATIYPAADWDIRTDPVSLIEYRVVLTSDITLTNPGTYYLAVYNPGLIGGRWRLQFGEQERFSSLLRWPERLWQDHAWAGWTWQTALLPFFIFAALISLCLYHRHHHIIHPKKNNRRKS